jgi:ketosteroid isomerase-like protein
VAIAAKDAAKVATFYGDDAMSFANGIETVKGRVAIQKSIVDKLKNGLADMTITVTEVRSDGDIGFRVARFRFPATTNGLEGASGTVFENWKRTKGKWLIAYENYIDDPKPAAKAKK